VHNLLGELFGIQVWLIISFKKKTKNKYFH